MKILINIPEKRFADIQRIASVQSERRLPSVEQIIANGTPLSSEPEQRWIPVSERLPEDGTECLVSVRCSKKITVVDMATYSTDLFKVDKEDFFGNRGESGWYYLHSEYGYCKVFNVIAWMPLPSPYREEGDQHD